MKVAFQKWGNSLALRVPKVVAQEIGAGDGKTAEMSVRDGKLVIESDQAEATQATLHSGRTCRGHHAREPSRRN